MYGESLDYIAKIQQLLDSGDGDGILGSVYDNNNISVVIDTGMELVQILCLPLRHSSCDRFLFECLMCALEHLIRICKPKEMLVAMLEQAEYMKTDAFFKAVTSLLRRVFIRLPERRGDNILWTLSTMLQYAQTLPAPDYNDIITESEAGVLAENCPNTKRILQVVQMCLDFVQPFVSEAAHCMLDSRSIESICQQVWSLCSFLLLLLIQPLGALAIKVTEKMHADTETRTIVRRLLQYVNELAPGSWVTVLQWYKSRKLQLRCPQDLEADKFITVDKACVGVLCHLLLVENLAKESGPQIYSPTHRLLTLVNYCGAMISHSHPRIVFKGVELTRFLQANLCVDEPWNSDVLKISGVTRLFSSLIHCMNFCECEDTRREALIVFDAQLTSFSLLAGIDVVRMVFYKVRTEASGWVFPRDGIVGHLIDNYRMWLLRHAPDPNSCVTASLPEMLTVLGFLPDGYGEGYGEVLQHSQQINGFLVLLQSLALSRSPNLHSPLIHEAVKSTMLKYVKPLKESLDATDSLMQEENLKIASEYNNHPLEMDMVGTAESAVYLMLDNVNRCVHLWNVDMSDW